MGKSCGNPRGIPLEIPVIIEQLRIYIIEHMAELVAKRRFNAQFLCKRENKETFDVKLIMKAHRERERERELYIIYI